MMEKAASPNITVLAGGTLDLPKFDPEVMSAESFLKDVEAYFVDRRIGGEQKVNVLHKCFKNQEHKLWWETTRTEVKSWEEFSTMFKKAFSQTKEALEEKLIRSRQKWDEKFNAYALRVKHLFLKLDKNASDRVIIKRILRGALPDTANFLTGAVIPDFQSLLKLGKAIEENLVRKEFFQRKSGNGTGKRDVKEKHDSREKHDSKEKIEPKKGFSKVPDMSEIKCFNCNSMGHFAKDCKKPQRVRKVKVAQVEEGSLGASQASQTLNSQTGGSIQ